MYNHNILLPVAAESPGWYKNSCQESLLQSGPCKALQLAAGAVPWATTFYIITTYQPGDSRFCFAHSPERHSLVVCTADDTPYCAHA